ncbi:hypothetical protein DMA12_00685 [Amycolatopsis balhimycina DSM 5908]|uniref:Uncharacterized protein n=1 Tax=Amycolatopsis balhimycina DSM 5908 TaxID=1081091 RepID=A0A428X6I0_AMYBA|nr:hypothetical protein [Amycolatopsis balhimycina]RSM50916.1 hypothetical protein DMA12_00685 [Amycolatopsis balhimycina DSM 5908]
MVTEPELTRLELAGRDLVSAELFDRLVTRIAREQAEVTRGLAARIMDQALAFLAACGADRGASLSPSELVDIGWHTFLMYTKEYRKFCDRVTHGFIHHVPNDDGQETGAEVGDRVEIARTMDAVAAAGFAVDPQVWLARAAKCNSGDDGCRSSGEDGNENTETNGSGR